jgi:hypothetical protein
LDCRSHNEVSKIEPLGFWILSAGKVYFVPFDDYPVIKKATIQQIFNMQAVSPHQLHWPDLDADIELAALECPDHFSLIFKS